jgi:hypothetical protein
MGIARGNGDEQHDCQNELKLLHGLYLSFEKINNHKLHELH